MTDTPKLLPCPSCGKRAVQFFKLMDPPIPGFVQCEDCPTVAANAKEWNAIPRVKL